MHIQRFDGANLLDPYQQQLLSEAQKRAQKQIEPLDFDHTEEGSVWIYNIGPSQQQVSQGGLGTFTSLACPANRTYGEPLPIWKKFPEGKNDDLQKMSLRICDGFAIAESVVGYGKFMGSNAESIFTVDLRNLGIFTCGAYVTIELGSGDEKRSETVLASERINVLKQARIDRIKAVVVNTREVTPAAIKAFRKSVNSGWTRDERTRELLTLKTEEQISDAIMSSILPTERELDEAQERMNKFCLRLVEVANAFYREGKLGEINPQMRWAAAVTGNTGLPWVAGSLLMSKCEVCGNSLPPDVAICLGCKSVVTGKEGIVAAKHLVGYESYWDPAHPSYIGYKFGGPKPKQAKEATA